MRNFTRQALSFLCAFALLISVAPSMEAQQNPPSNQSYVGGRFVARNYNYPGVRIFSGNNAAGIATITLSSGSVRLQDGRTIVPFSAGGLNTSGTAGPFPAIPISVGAGAVEETVTPTAVSGCYVGAPQGSCSVTASFTYAHGQGELVASGSDGIQEAINDAGSLGGGLVVVDPSLNTYSGGQAATTALVAAALVVPNVSIEDVRTGQPRYWTPTPTGAALAVPTTLTAQAACDATHQFCSDAGVAGSASYAGGTLYGCVAYIDIMGNEGPCSLTASYTDVSTKAIDVGAPVASPGAVGYVVYLSLDAGTYAQAYQIPSTASNCTLTTLETVTPACAVANTTYNQAASTFGVNTLFKGGSQIATYPVSTGLHFTQLASTVQTTVSLTPMTNSSVTYSYAPSNRVGIPGVSSWNAVQENAAGGTSASSTTGIPMSMGTWTIPAGYFNYIGAEFRVSGKIRETPGGASDALKLIVAWDAAGTNTTTVPTTLCNIANTHTEAAAQQTGYFSCTVKILTTGATGTALVNGSGFFDIATGAAGVLIGGANDTAVAASGSINLTVPARIAVRFSNTGSTVTNAQPLEAALEVLN